MVSEGKTPEAHTLQPPTSLDEAQPPRRWFPLWHWFRKTLLHMPASEGFTYLRSLSLFGHPGGPGIFINTLTSLGGDSHTPWPTSLHANCSHSFPLGAPLGGRPCFQ